VKKIADSGLIIAALDKRDAHHSWARSLELVRKYRDQQIDLADACVIRMSELFEDSVVYTVDKTDFMVYRRRGRQPIPCVFPD